MADVKPAEQFNQIDSFIDHLWLEDGLSKNTLESYRADLSQFATWLGKHNKQILAANQADIQQYLAVNFHIANRVVLAGLLPACGAFIGMRCAKI